MPPHFSFDDEKLHSYARTAATASGGASLKFCLSWIECASSKDKSLMPTWILLKIYQSSV